MIFCLVVFISAYDQVSGSELVLSNPNQKVVLPCNLSRKADKMRWYFRRSPSHEEVFVYDSKFRPYDGYVGRCDAESLRCDLEILNATVERAGRYRFEHGVNGNQRIQECDFELIVGDLECHSNTRSNGIMIGENDCNVRADTLRRSCSFRHSGNYDGGLNFFWMLNVAPGKIIMDRILKLSSASVESESRIFSVEDEVEVSSRLHDTHFECSLGGHKQVRSCQLPRVYVQHIRNNTETSPPMKFDDFHESQCSVDKSDSISCSYEWALQNSRVNLTLDRQHFTKEHLLIPGSYRCIARCYFVSGEECIATGSQLSVLDDICDYNQGRTAIVISAFFSILLGIAVIVILTLYFVKKFRSTRLPCRKRNKVEDIESGPSKTMLDGNASKETDNY